MSAREILENIFKPTQDFGPFIPLLAGIGMIVLSVLLTWCVFEIVQYYKSRSHKWTRFDQVIDRMALSNSERHYLLQAAYEGAENDPSRILRSPSSFDRVIRDYALKHGGADRAMIDALRSKLFGDEQELASIVNSTNALDAGSKVHMKIGGQPGVALEGEVAGVSEDGMVVAFDTVYKDGQRAEWVSQGMEKGVVAQFPNGKMFHVPIEPKSRVELNVISTTGDTLHFFTFLRNVIPGPQRMAAIDHTNMVNMRGRSRLAPSYRRNRPVMAR